MQKLFIITTMLVLAFTVNAQDLTKNKFGKGITILAQDSSFKMKISTRFQTLFLAEMPADNNGTEDLYTNFLIRRARLKFDGWIHSPKIKYKVEWGFSNRDIGDVRPQKSNTANLILDAVLKWNFAGNMEVWAGQTKLPGNRERVISSQKLQLVDRSLLNSRYNIDRDMGVQLRNHFSAGNHLFRQALAFSQGEGRNITAGNSNQGYEYTARIEWLPMGAFTGGGDYFAADLKREQSPKLSVGLTYDLNQKSLRERGNLGSYVDDTLSTDLETFFADLMFKYKGFSLMAEYADKRRSTDIVQDTTGAIVGNFYTGTGMNFAAGYLFKSNVELTARYTSITPSKDSMRDIQNMYTFGISKYVVNHSLKIQTDFSYIDETNQFTDDSAGEYMFRFQFEIAF